MNKNDISCTRCDGKICPCCISKQKLKQAQIQDLNTLAEKAQKGKVTLKEYKPISVEVQEKAMAEEEGSEVERIAAVPPIYYYHPDHLGTSTVLTDFNGNAYQFFLNLPFGETMAQQLGSNYYNSPFKFNGKELDEETGFYYYGARYYDPKISLWLSVDPLAEEFPEWSPYNYTMNNPINLIDPDGRAPEPPKNGIPQFIDNTGFYYWRADKKQYEHYKYTDSSRSSTTFSGYYTVNSNSKAVGKSVSIDNNASNFKYVEPETSLQEVNVGVSLSIKLGPISGSFGPEIAFGNAENGFNSAGRTIFSGSFDIRKIFDAKTWSKTTFELKGYLGAKTSNEPTLKSGFKSDISSFEKFDIGFFGNGAEFKVSHPDSNPYTNSYSFGVKAGVKAKPELNVTGGRELKYTGSALATDKSCY